MKETKMSFGKKLSLTLLLCSAAMNFAQAKTINDQTFNSTGTQYLSENTQFLDCDFLNNTGDQNTAGAIYSKGFTLTIDDSDFKINISNYKGGAILVEQATLNINDSDFEKNYALMSGGAVCVDQTTLNINDSDFESNFARDNGGAIYSSEGNFTISNTEFVNNVAETGAAIYAIASGDKTVNWEISNCEFVGNYVDANSDSDIYGGAIYARGGTLTVENTVFTNNKVEFRTHGRGGAIAMRSGTLNVSGCSFTGNSADKEGGAIYIEKSANANLIADFSGNYAKDSGGAIYIEEEGTVGTISGTFTNNTAFCTSGGGDWGGGAISNVGSIETITGTFTSNTAGNYGGAILNRSAGTIGSISGTFTSNTADEGGAIYSSGSGKIETITGTFTDNSATTWGGGAIYNSSKIGTISGTFTNNTSTRFGGAINNYCGTVGEIYGVFTNNSATSDDIQDGLGGAIYNYWREITTIDGTFTNNSACDGGAIANYYCYDEGSSAYAKIQSLTGTFVGNTAQKSGGAIHNNDGLIEYIRGTFSKNTAGIDGGAIYNDDDAKITEIANSVFNANSADNKGGAIYAEGAIDSITATFTNNSAGLDGGAIYATADISSMKAVFANNSTEVDGGAIYSTANMTITVGKFTNNSAVAGSGGAIYNSGVLTLSPTVGDMVFTGNTDCTGSNALYNAKGVEIRAGTSSKLIFNDTIRNADENSTVSLHSGTMELNNLFYGGGLSVESGSTLKLGSYTASDGTTSYGGFGADATGALVMLDLSGTLDMQNGRIETHELSSLSSFGAKVILDMDLNDQSESGEYQADLLSTATLSGSSYSLDLSGVNLLSGMPTATSGSVRLLSSDNLASIWNSFSIDNYYVYCTAGMLKLSKSGTVGMMDFEWDDSRAYSLKEAVSATPSSGETSVQYNLIQDEYVSPLLGTQVPTNLYIKGNGESSIIANGTLVYGITTSGDKSLTITDVKSFTGFWNKESGGALVNEGTLIVRNTGFSDNRSTEGKGGAICNSGSAELSNVTITGNRSEKHGGAVYNKGTISIFSGTASNNSTHSNGGAVYNEGTISSLSGTFTGNSAPNGFGGAICNIGTITIVADGEDTVFTGNEDYFNGSNALYNYHNGSVKLHAANGSKIVFDDAISGDGTGSISLEYGTTRLNNTLSKNTLTLSKFGTLMLGSNTQNGTKYYGTLDSTATLSVSGGTVSLQNGEINSANLGNLSLNGDLNLCLDANLADNTMDTITVSSLTNSGGYKIKISNITILQASDAKTFSISPIGEISDENLKTSLASAIQYTGGEIVYSPIYKYTATYDAATATFTFSLNSSTDYTPSVMVAPVAAQAAYLGQLDLYESAFENVDGILAMEAVSLDAQPEAEEPKNRTVWARVYGSDEDIALDGVKTSNETFGILVGMDSQVYKLKDSWKGMLRVFAGYNNSQQKYDDVKISQDGGNVGFAGIVAKENFFTGLTATAGMSFGEANTIFGDEDFQTFTTGIASKTGYNFKFSEGKYIVQPNATVSYSYIDVHDYTNAAGVRISAAPLHVIQLEPGVKFVACLSNGWQPYAGISAVWSIMDADQFDANDVSLPETSVDPYAKYSLGVRKSFSDDIHGYVNGYATSGGREGFGAQIGVSLKW